MDKTKQIARQYTEKVYDFAWQDDFAKARNFAFSKGTCDYLMWLDADDVVTPENVERIPGIKAHDGRGGGSGDDAVPRCL